MGQAMALRIGGAGGDEFGNVPSSVQLVCELLLIAIRRIAILWVADEEDAALHALVHASNMVDNVIGVTHAIRVAAAPSQTSL
jgi:hypothetical protein